MRGNTSQLIRRLVMKLLAPEKAPKPNDPQVQQKLSVWLHEFDQQIIVRFNEELTKHQCLCGAKLSVIDIIVYCEIYQVLKMYKR